MKKLAAGVIALALAAALGGTAVLAAGHGWHGQGQEGCGWCGTSCQYTDADGDGVCDNWTGGGQGYVDADGDGVCDHYTGGGHHRGGGHHGWGGRL